MTDTLHQEPERDQFKSESPIRAFTDWQVNGRYALGKGFRPSLQHVIPYLEAMERKEGWRVVQILEAGAQTPSFLFRLDREPTLAELRERYPHLDFDLPEEEPFVRNREGFEEAGRKIDQAREMAAGMERTEIGGHLAFVFRGLDSETTFWNRARWNGKPEEAMKAMASMKPVVLAEFLETHNVESVAHFWRSASVAAVLRLIDKLDWWDRVSLADPITHDELTKALGRTPPASAIAAMSADPYKAVADFIQDQPLGEAYEPQPPVSAIGDDPVNPKHYGGTACAEIGELLTANSYQVLKYNWRLGEKDEPCQEIDKSLWYLDREIALLSEGNVFIPGDHRLPDHVFFDRRLEDRSEHTKEVARKLISWNRYGKVETLRLLRKLLQDKRATFTCGDVGRSLAI